MNISLEMNGKELICPDFKVMLDEENNILIGIKNYTLEDKLNIKNNMKADNSLISFQDNTLLLPLKDKVYSFDLSDYDYFFSEKVKDFFLGFAFFDNNDKILEGVNTFIKIKCK